MYKIVSHTHWNWAEGIVLVFQGCDRVLSAHTKASIFGPTLPRRPVWHMGEHPPKLRTVSGISGATECLEEKPDYICLSFYLCETWMQHLFLQVLLEELGVYTLLKVFLLPVQPMLCCVITHLMSGWYGNGENTLIGHSPGSIVPTAAFIPRANSFHLSLLASLCHLVPLQTFAVCNRHLVL